MPDANLRHIRHRRRRHFQPQLPCGWWQRPRRRRRRRRGRKNRRRGEETITGATRGGAHRGTTTISRPPRDHSSWGTIRGRRWRQRTRERENGTRTARKWRRWHSGLRRGIVEQRWRGPWRRRLVMRVLRHGWRQPKRATTLAILALLRHGGGGGFHDTLAREAGGAQLYIHRSYPGPI